MFLLYGGAISQTSKRQQSIALSSYETEYMAQTEAAKLATQRTKYKAKAYLEQLDAFIKRLVVV